MFLMHGLGAPSAWVQRFTPLLKPASRVLDLACGGGRHVQWLAAQGHQVLALDRDAAALARVREAVPGAEVLQADVEGGPWPLAGRQFDAIVVTNYLWRPLLPALLGALAEGGVYLHETFADGHQHIGRPSRPDFLLQSGELLRVCAGLRVLAYEDGYEPGPASSWADGQEGGRCVQRIVAVNESAAAGIQARWPLGTPA
ncbi:SAM-dependent methyltransferase [beta proteobacterium AAP51]|nr:SAM-dependent methyltransferase [beta proteobacterium AAP51]